MSGSKIISTTHPVIMLGVKSDFFRGKYHHAHSVKSIQKALLAKGIKASEVETQAMIDATMHRLGPFQIINPAVKGKSLPILIFREPDKAEEASDFGKLLLLAKSALDKRLGDGIRDIDLISDHIGSKQLIDNPYMWKNGIDRIQSEVHQYATATSTSCRLFELCGKGQKYSQDKARALEDEIREQVSLVNTAPLVNRLNTLARFVKVEMIKHRVMECVRTHFGEKPHPYSTYRYLLYRLRDNLMDAAINHGTTLPAFDQTADDQITQDAVSTYLTEQNYQRRGLPFRKAFYHGGTKVSRDSITDAIAKHAEPVRDAIQETRRSGFEEKKPEP